MAGFRKPEAPREQMVLWSQRLEDAIPEEHPVRQVDWLLRSKAFAATLGEWERHYLLVEGQPPYHPRNLSGLYLYGMMSRIRSSRQLEAACWNRMEERGVTAFLPDSGQRETPAPDCPTGQALGAAREGRVLTEEQWAALPLNQDKHISHLAFTYDPARDAYRCPMGQMLGFMRMSGSPAKWGQAHRRQYGGCPACANCPRAAQCCENPAKGRIVNRDQYEPCRERLRARMGSEHGRSRYRLRKQTVEPRIGHIKHVLGLRRFMRRGLDAARTEWLMACTVVNIGILLRCWDRVAVVVG